ncbi:NaCP60E [Symbiodinium sp. CCMP2592]|nr:NaCP60E [Symbiodinium sp. CCMP2592]
MLFARSRLQYLTKASDKRVCLSDSPAVVGITLASFRWQELQQYSAALRSDSAAARGRALQDCRTLQHEVMKYGSAWLRALMEAEELRRQVERHVKERGVLEAELARLRAEVRALVAEVQDLRTAPLGSPLAMAEKWVLYAEVPELETSSITYMGKIVIDFDEELKGPLGPLATVNCNRSASATSAFRRGDASRVALNAYCKADPESQGYLEQHGVHTFLEAVFQQHGLTPPLKAHVDAMYHRFGPEEDRLEALACLCLADAMLRSVLRMHTEPASVSRTVQSTQDAANSCRITSGGSEHHGGGAVTGGTMLDPSRIKRVVVGNSVGMSASSVPNGSDELRPPDELPEREAAAVRAALERWRELRLRVEVLRPMLEHEDRLMQDILDRGLGSEDRKTLRKLASVGAQPGICPTRVDLFGIVTLQLQVRAMQKQKLHRLDVKSVQIRKLLIEDHMGCTKQLAMAGCRLCRPADVEGSYFSGVVTDCKARTLIRIHIAESSEAKVGQERHRLQEILMQNHRELLELSTTTTPDDKKELISEMDSVLDELKKAQDAVHVELLATKDMSAVRAYGRSLNDLKALTRRLDCERRSLTKNSALAMLLVTVCRRILPARKIDPSELMNIPATWNQRYLRILDFYFFSDASLYCFGEHFSGPNWFTRLKRNVAILSVSDGDGKSVYNDFAVSGEYKTPGAPLAPDNGPLQSIEAADENGRVFDRRHDAEFKLLTGLCGMVPAERRSTWRARATLWSKTLGNCR